MSSPFHRARRRAALACAAVALIAASGVGGHAFATTEPVAEPPKPAADHHHAPGTPAHDHAAPLTAVPTDDPARGLRYRGLRAARTGACVGSFEIAGVTPTMCTHGPDAPPPGLAVGTRIKPLAARVAQLAPQALPVCEGDGVSGKRVEVLYIHGSTSRYAQYLETFRTLAEAVDTIFYESARQTGGSRRVRYVTETVGGACRPVVRDVQIPDSALNANDWAPLLNAVKGAGFTRTDRKYLQFVDAKIYCGIGGFAGDTRKTAQNRSNTGPEYARMDSGCWNAGTAAHELGHTLGAVNNNAPNSSGKSHCVDEYDVMCYKDNASTVIRIVCGDRANDQRLDCNHDDYYHTDPAPGSYLATNYNVADNPFLINDGGGTAPPSPPTSAPPSVPTTFRLVNGGAAGCLDLPAGAGADGTQLVVGTCGSGTSQVITQAGSALQVLGKCLDAFGAGTAAGTRVVLWPCNGGTNQQWTVRPDGSIAGIPSGRCLAPDVAGGAAGSRLILADCNGQADQHWSRG